MATMTFSISGSAIINGSKGYTISDVDVQRLLNALAIIFPQDAGSNGPLLIDWTQMVVNHTISQVRAVETANAVSTAQQGVTPIGIS